MRFRLSFAAAMSIGIGIAHPAAAQDDAAIKRRLDNVLSVLRTHQSDAGKSCLDAMTQVHDTEDQVGKLGTQDTNSSHPDNGADVARDVLESDYETAEQACRPDAQRVCAADPALKGCATLSGAAAPSP